MTKYEPLESHLRDLKTDRVTLTFDEIESLIGSRLPSSSRKYEAHWRSAGPGRPGGAIEAAGWRVDNVSWVDGLIRLARGAGMRRTGGPPRVHGEVTPAVAPVAWQSLEGAAAVYFSNLWDVELKPRVVKVGGVPKSFDLVSRDGRFVGDCKQYKNIPTPSAKWQGIAEYVWLLQHVDAERRFLVFGGDALVAQRFLDRWRAIVGPIEFYHLTAEGHRRM